MNRGLVLEFTKMHGAGNDFIVIDNRFFFFSLEELSAIAKKYCPRHLGIGADGVLALEPPRQEGHHYYMTYINADGSQGEMCGNGARCLARFAFDAGLEYERMTFGTISGIHEAFVSRDSDRVRIILPEPSLVNPEYTSIEVQEEALDFSLVVVGVPHAVCFIPDVRAVSVGDIGPVIRHHADFIPSHGANVDFVEIVESNPEPHLKVRCYERGVEAETMACGTGAVGCFVAAYSGGQIKARTATIEMPGGKLQVGYVSENSQSLYLEGPVETVYRGTIVL